MKMDDSQNLNSVCYINKEMKLQKFIQNYRKDKYDQAHSPQRSAIFHTSESIGTLNSRDEAPTDRSFAIKQIPLHHQLSSFRKQSTQQVQHLRDLCESQRPVVNSKIHQKECLQPIQQFSYQPERSQSILSATFSKTNKVAPKPSFSFRPEPVEQTNDQLYEEAPSKYVQANQDKMGCLLSFQEQRFLMQYKVLMERAEKLQQQNLILEQEWLQQQKMALRYQRGCQVLSNQVGALKERVTSIIQQNIQIENMIKEMLLKQEMQKYKYFTIEDSRKIIKKQTCLSKIKLPL